MVGPTPATAAAPVAAPGGASAKPQHHWISFGDVLSALNPLQYLPVVGTLYRALTGDTVAEPLRVAGGLVVSALMGGPVGVLINLASTAVEKLAGIDPDRIAHNLLAAIGLARPDPPPAIAAAWTAPQRAAYGVTPPPATIIEAGAVEPDAGRQRMAMDAYARALSGVA